MKIIKHQTEKIISLHLPSLNHVLNSHKGVKFILNEAFKFINSCSNNRRIKKTNEHSTNKSEERQTNAEQLLLSFITHYAYLYQSVVFMTSGVAKSPCASTETNPGHIFEVCPAPGEGGAV